MFNQPGHHVRPCIISVPCFVEKKSGPAGSSIFKLLYSTTFCLVFLFCHFKGGVYCCCACVLLSEYSEKTPLASLEETGFGHGIEEEPQKRSLVVCRHREIGILLCDNPFCVTQDRYFSCEKSAKEARCTFAVYTFFAVGAVLLDDPPGSIFKARYDIYSQMRVSEDESMAFGWNDLENFPRMFWWREGWRRNHFADRQLSESVSF